MTTATAPVSMASLAALAAQQTIQSTPVDTSDVAGTRTVLAHLRMSAEAQKALTAQQWPEGGFIHGSGISKETKALLPITKGLKMLNGKIAVPKEAPASDMEIRIMSKLYPNQSTPEDTSSAAIDLYVQCGRKGYRRGQASEITTKKVARLGFVSAGTEHGSVFLRGRPHDEHQLPFRAYEVSVHIEEVNGNPETLLVLSGIS